MTSVGIARLPPALTSCCSVCWSRLAFGVASDGGFFRLLNNQFTPQPYAPKPEAPTISDSEAGRHRDRDELTARGLPGQGDADTGHAQRLSVAGQHADHEPEHTVGGRPVRDGGEQRRLRVLEGAQQAGPGGAAEARGAGRDKGHADLRVAITGMHQGKRRQLLDLPGADLFILQAALQGGDEFLAARIVVGVDGDLHAHMIPSGTTGQWSWRQGLPRFSKKRRIAARTGCGSRGLSVGAGAVCPRAARSSARFCCQTTQMRWTAVKLVAVAKLSSATVNGDQGPNLRPIDSRSRPATMMTTRSGRARIPTSHVKPRLCARART